MRNTEMKNPCPYLNIFGVGAASLLLPYNSIAYSLSQQSPPFQPHPLNKSINKYKIRKDYPKLTHTVAIR